MKWIDTHAHVYDFVAKGDDSLEAMVARSQQAGVTQVYMPNLNVATLPRMLAVADRFPDVCYPMLGLHPCDVQRDWKTQLAKLESWLGKRPFVAIGEIGLDLYHSRTYEKEQVMALAAQVDWARSHGLPLVIHCREAFEVLLPLLEQWQDGQLQGVIHCFTGTLAQAHRCIALGFYLGIGGLVTYKNAGVADLVQALPLAHLVLETDTPYLAPVPWRGKPNEPSYVPSIAEKVAALHNVTVEHVSAITTENALALFGGKGG